jgi:hypothetical protein
MSDQYLPKRAAAITAVANRFVTTTNMKVGAYTVANASSADGTARTVRITVTKNIENDTMGTITVVGTDVHGKAQTEVIIPNNGDTSGGVKDGVLAFQTVTSITGAGWVSGGSIDTIVIGTSTTVGIANKTGTLHTVTITSTVASIVTIADSLGTIAVLKASIAEQTLTYNCLFVGWLTITPAGATDLTATYKV